MGTYHVPVHSLDNLWGNSLSIEPSFLCSWVFNLLSQHLKNILDGNCYLKVEGVSEKGLMDYLLWTEGNIKYILALPYCLVRSIVTMIFHFISNSGASLWISVTPCYNSIMTLGNILHIGLFAFISYNSKLDSEIWMFYNFYFLLFCLFSSLWGNTYISLVFCLFITFS